MGMKECMMGGEAVSREQRRKRQDVTLEEGATLGKRSRHRSELRNVWLGFQ